MHTAKNQPRQIETAQGPALQEQQRQHVGRSVALSVVRLCTQLVQQREQLLLQSRSLQVRAAQAHKQGSYDEALLDLPHVFTRGGQFQSLLDQMRQPALLDLAGRLRDEACGGILQHHRLQGEASRPLPVLDQAAAAQPLQGFEHLHRRPGCAEDCQQLLQANRLAQDGQPQQHALLGCRQAGELLVEQLPHPPKDHLTLLQEGDNLAPEQLGDGMRHDL